MLVIPAYREDPGFLDPLQSFGDDGGRLLAILVLGVGYCFLFWLTLRIILTGTKVMLLPFEDKQEKRKSQPHKTRHR